MTTEQKYETLKKHIELQIKIHENSKIIDSEKLAFINALKHIKDTMDYLDTAV